VPQGTTAKAVRLRATRADEYQIGEVQARSWCSIGTSFDILMQERTWSYAVQRGVEADLAAAEREALPTAQHSPPPRERQVRPSRPPRAGSPA
jgi:hypothetical protein